MEIVCGDCCGGGEGVIYVITGPVGAGKSMMATQRLIDYAREGRRVCANYHVDFSKCYMRRTSRLSSAAVEVVADRPTAADLDALGVGGPSEEKAGLIVIDEAGTFLNARTWGAEDRAAIIRWMLLSRKRRWDMILIVQAVGILDKQIREAVVEVCGRVRRMDRIKIPGTNISMPRIHLATMRYGTNPNDVVIERWWTRGGEAVSCYDTTALFESQGGAYTVLPASLTKWRYVPVPSWQRALQGFKAGVRGLVGPRPVRVLPGPSPTRPAWVRRLESLPVDVRAQAWNRLRSVGAIPV